MLRRFIVLLSVLFLCCSLGCLSELRDDDCDTTPNRSPIPSETVKVYKIMISSNVPGPKVGPILDAAAEWTTALDGAFAFEVVYADFDPNSQPNNGEMRVYLGPKDPKTTIIGTARTWGPDVAGRPTRSIIWLSDSLDDRTFYLTALHEIGHAIGLDHSNDPDSIMQPTITDIGDHVRCADKKTACVMWGCIPDC